MIPFSTGYYCENYKEIIDILEILSVAKVRIDEFLAKRIVTHTFSNDTRNIEIFAFNRIQRDKTTQRNLLRNCYFTTSKTRPEQFSIQLQNLPSGMMQHWTVWWMKWSFQRNSKIFSILFKKYHWMKENLVVCHNSRMKGTKWPKWTNSSRVYRKYAFGRSYNCCLNTRAEWVTKRYQFSQTVLEIWRFRFWRERELYWE